MSFSGYKGTRSFTTAPGAQGCALRFRIEAKANINCIGRSEKQAMRQEPEVQLVGISCQSKVSSSGGTARPVKRGEGCYQARLTLSQLSSGSNKRASLPNSCPSL